MREASCWHRCQSEEYRRNGIHVKASNEAGKAYVFESRASSVEQMRCETCKTAFTITGEDGEGVPCSWIGCGGCWKWEKNEIGERMLKYCPKTVRGADMSSGDNLEWCKSQTDPVLCAGCEHSSAKIAQKKKKDETGVDKQMRLS